jgi:threonine synthase
MRYVSTRGEAPVRDFAGVLLAGLAEDGGLYMPEAWPVFSGAEWRALRGLDYAALAAQVMAPFTEGAVGAEVLEALCAEAYTGFSHPAVAPLVQLGPGLWTMELFHGPTLAFKDFALQLLGRLFDLVLRREGRRATIVAATSGDTGSAAIAACRDRAAIDIAVLHPAGRVSEVQRRQMTTVLAPNVTNIAVDGTFDDCQDLVKGMFADAPFRRRMGLSAVNSINWARIAAQIPYYAYAALALGAPDRPVAFSVPTGNFGNVLAAYAAGRMGLPIGGLMVASNRNDILYRFLERNDMRMAGVTPSLSPSMDIEVSSNFERLLFELLDRDAGATAALMQGFRASGHMDVPDAAWRRARGVFRGCRLDDAATIGEMTRLRDFAGYVADPHSAVGIGGARLLRPGLDAAVPVVAMATAHPAKFPEAVLRATGRSPALPPALADLYERPERYECLPARLDAIEARVSHAATRNAA